MADVSLNVQVHQREAQALARGLAIGPLGEDVAELRIRELVDGALQARAEVAPAITRGLESHAVDLAAGWLESLVRILRRDTRSAAVGGDGRIVHGEEIDLGILHWVHSIELPDVWDVVERNAHGNVQLGGGHVDPGDGFSHGVFHLETWVQFQEAKRVGLGAVEILHGAGTLIAHQGCEAHASTLHLMEDILFGDGGRTFFEDLLESPLCGAIAAVQGQGVAVFVAHDLDLQVTGLGHHLHQKNGGARHFGEDVGEGHLQLLHVGGLTDALSSATFRGFDHDGKPNLLCSCACIFCTCDHGLVEDVLWDGALLGELASEAVSTPRNAGHFGSLRQDVGRDLVAQGSHAT
mmetsp:Transcript_50411/g.82956  ORF Transcript_50411/g.82956 Transcript_50411/m.82956 type:complete len:350 (+) Transcript_50411:438-1487(+)